MDTGQRLVGRRRDSRHIPEFPFPTTVAVFLAFLSLEDQEIKNPFRQSVWLKGPDMPTGLSPSKLQLHQSVSQSVSTTLANSSTGGDD